jgi:hypothetical protein
MGQGDFVLKLTPSSTGVGVRRQGAIAKSLQLHDVGGGGAAASADRVDTKDMDDYY